MNGHEIRGFQSICTQNQNKEKNKWDSYKNLFIEQVYFKNHKNIPRGAFGRSIVRRLLEEERCACQD